MVLDGNMVNLEIEKHHRGILMWLSVWLRCRNTKEFVIVMILVNMICFGNVYENPIPCGGVVASSSEVSLDILILILFAFFIKV